MAAFTKGDIVKTSAKAIAAGTPARAGGVVKYVACYLATNAGGKTCDKKTCAHAIKDYIWVAWATGTFSYHHEEIEFERIKPSVMPDAKEFAAKAADAAATIKRATEAGALGADSVQTSDVNWKLYNTKLPGDTRARTDRRAVREPIAIASDDDIDWAAYAGFDRSKEPGSYRKQSHR